jgi:DNA polymerase I-like protein with 3'-5' exonuclease and polymerase domains/uracil-DNA glycosylase
MGFGFFDTKELPKATYEGNVPKLKNYAASCSTCQQYKYCAHGQLPAVGLGEKKILVITGETTRAEDDSNNERHGQRYAYLRKAFRLCGIDLEKDCWYTHAIKCYFKGKSSNKIVHACHNKLMTEIRELQPEHIVVLDQEAWETLLYDRLGGRASYASHYDWCGEVIPDQKLKTWIHPIYNPSWVMDGDEHKVNKFTLHWHMHIKNILSAGDLPLIDVESKCKIFETETLAYAALAEVKTWPVFAFDYETTGIKPFRKGHDIWYVSFSNGKISYAMPFFKTPSFREAVADVLRNSATKIAHNLTFEMMWSEHILKVYVKNATQDTVLLQHCRNNKKPTGLKFLSYAMYGFLGYDEEMDEYLECSTEEKQKYGANGINTIHLAPPKKAMLYNAMDSLFTFWLYEDLPKDIPDLSGYNFFIEGQHALYESTMNGMVLDEAEMQKQKVRLTKMVEPLYNEIMNNDLVVKQWDGGYKFSPKSDYDVRILLYKILKLEVVKRTDKNEPSVDEEALEYYKSKHDIIPALLEFRRWSKALNTYIGQYERENNNGRLHAFYGLNRVATFRGNSNSPNLQNTPIRDKEVMNVIRVLLKAKKGHKFIEYDYKANEVGGAASISGDPNLIRYVSDPSSDMHRDISTQLYLLPPEQVNGTLRNLTKGPFVFATFYGSYWELTAKSLWDGLHVKDPVKTFGLDVIAHLKQKGIKTYKQWEEHVKENERILWEERFPVYQEWRRDTFDFFCKKGYVDYPNGFRYYGPATKNEVLNAPVQGPSFHCMLWSFTKTTNDLLDKKMNSCLMGQVHDSILASVDPAEEAWMDRLIYENGTQRVREFYPWIKVPLMIEKAATGVDEPWSMKKTIGYLKGE